MIDGLTVRIIALFVIAGILALLFIAVQFWQQDNATVPPRILKQRSIASGAWFVFCLGASFFSMIYYIPLWFQAIQGVSAVGSGIRNLPMILGTVIASSTSGILTTLIGYYTPFMLVSSVLMSIGAGLLTTFTVGTGHAKWIGYQFLYGFGVGNGMQQGLIAAQTVCALEDVPVGTSIINFSVTLGGALFVSVSNNILNNRLLTNLATSVPSLDSNIDVGLGATDLRNAANPANIGAILHAYNDALMQAFYVAVAMSSLSIIGAVGMEWKSVKGKPIEAAVI